MDKRKRQLSDFDSKYILNPNNVSTPRQISPIDQFDTLSISDPNNPNDTVVKYVDDIYMLFNADRLSRVLSPSDLSAYITYLKPSERAGFDKLTDEQLIQFIKSRHIQTPSELLTWSEYLLENYESVISELNSEPSPEPEPTPAPTPTE